MAVSEVGFGLSARGVGMVYTRHKQSTTALIDCNLDVPRGSWTSLIGASGCGKSTLLRILPISSHRRKARHVCTG